MIIMSQIFFGPDAVVIVKPAVLLNPRELFGLPCVLCHRKQFCEVNKAFLSKHENGICFQPASVPFEKQDGSSHCPILSYEYLILQNKQ